MKKNGPEKIHRIQEIREQKQRADLVAARGKLADRTEALARAERALAMQKRLAKKAEEGLYDDLLRTKPSGLGFAQLEVTLQSILLNSDLSEDARNKRKTELDAAEAALSAASLLHAEAFRAVEVWRQIVERRSCEARIAEHRRTELEQELDAPPKRQMDARL
ncbi:MAG: hypothetical protein AAGK71_14555 [Pseudomonadota bacterium]